MSIYYFCISDPIQAGTWDGFGADISSGKSGIYDYPANFNQEKKTEDITHFHPLTITILYSVIQ